MVRQYHMCRCQFGHVRTAVAWCTLGHYFLFFSNGKRKLSPFLDFSPPYTCCRSKPTSKKNNRDLRHHSSKKTVWRKYCCVLLCAIGDDCTLPTAWPYTAGIAEPSGFSLQTPASSKHIPNWKQKESQLNAQIHN